MLIALLLAGAAFVCALCIAANQAFKRQQNTPDYSTDGDGHLASFFNLHVSGDNE